MLLLQAFGLIAAASTTSASTGAPTTARDGKTRPIAVGGRRLLAVYSPWRCRCSLDGLEGLAIGMAMTVAAGLAARAYYVTRLFPRFRILAPHRCGRSRPRSPRPAPCCGLRMLASGERTAGMAAVEFAVYVAVTLAATGLLERPLLREVLGYLRRGRAAAPA